MENLIKDMKIQYPVSRLLKTKDRKCIIIKKKDSYYNWLYRDKQFWYLLSVFSNGRIRNADSDI